jgi:hypothetical protein
MHDRAVGGSAASGVENGVACQALRAERSRSGLPGSPVVPSHGGNVGGHALGREAGVVIPDGVVDAGVLVQFPFAEAFKIFIESWAALEHGLAQGLHHCCQDLVVGGIADGQVEAHPFRRRGLAFGHAGFVCFKDRRKVADFRNCPPLASKTGDLDLDDLPRLQQVAGHALIDGCGQGSNILGVGRMLSYKDALAVPDLDLAQQRQAMQSLAQGRTPDPKLTGQLALRRNPRALGQDADSLYELLCDNLG